jgi:uncharacterized membrane protein
MDNGSRWQQSEWMSLSRPGRALWSMVAGAILDVATVIVCAFNVISAQQAIAMALPAALMTAGGYIALLVPDPWWAWRRGFMHGCEAASRSDPRAATVVVAQKSVRTVRLSA